MLDQYVVYVNNYSWNIYTFNPILSILYRNKPELLPQVSRESGVHIITGTGYYVNSFLPEYAKNLTYNEMADTMTNEILHGIDDSGVRCGVIGEIGCTYPLKDSEKRALQAAALVQTRTGGPLMYCSH